jgi:hypothetical protein
MSNGFAETCQVAIQNTYATCGSVTRAKIAPLSPTAIKALFYGSDIGVGHEGAGNQEGWNEIKSLLKHQIEMQACGIRRSPLYDWLMSSNKPGQGRLVNVHRAARGPSLIAPFILGRQQSMWNADHWALVANVAGNAYSGGAPFTIAPSLSTNRVITVESSFGGTMELHADYFIPDKRIHVMARGSGGALTVTQWKIIQAAVNVAGTGIDVEVKLDQPNQTESGTLATAAFLQNTTATSGVVFLGINNIADVEYWCRNMLNVNTTKLVPFWYQTRRLTRCVDEKYEEFLKHMMDNNEWYSIFGDLPLAERNRQDEARDQVEWMNAFFFGERISNKQNLDNWGQLEAINTATSSTIGIDGQGDFMGFRANMIGVLPQLKACNRFIDNQGNAAGFPINTFLEHDVWDIVRARRSQNRPSNEIDIYTDETTADEFMQAFIAYSKVKTGDIARINIEQGFSEWGFPFRRFRLYKPMGVSVNLITDDFFNDLATAAGYSTSGAAPHGAGASGLGKFMMILDMGKNGTIYPAILSTNRKQYTVGDINDLSKIDKTYSCVMENPRQRKTLTSTTTTAVVECPANSLVVANFDKIVSGV